jgi:hypothetical protein
MKNRKPPMTFAKIIGGLFYENIRERVIFLNFMPF